MDFYGYLKPIFFSITTALFWTSLLQILSIYPLALYFGLHGVMLGALLAAIVRVALLLSFYKSVMASFAVGQNQ